jgi:uncharacterized delta-60 repeat protein
VNLVTGIPYTESVAIQGDGKIVTVGTYTIHGVGVFVQYYAVSRLNNDGTLDPSFGSGGTFLTNLNPQADNIAHDVAIQGDGKIVVDGVVSVPDVGGAIGLVRYNVGVDGQPDGSLDTTFGSGGIVVSSHDSSGFDSAYGVAIQADGKIIVSGRHTTTSKSGKRIDTILPARYLASDASPGSLTASASAVPADSRVTPTASNQLRESATRPSGTPEKTRDWGSSRMVSNMVDLSPNSSISQVAFYQDSNGDGVLQPGSDTLLGTATQTSPGVWTFTFPVNWAPNNSYKLFAQAKDNYDIVGDPFTLTLTVQ